MPSVLMIAYLGDAIYEVYVRNFLIKMKYPNMKSIQKESLNYVSASSQRRIIESLIDNNILTNEEIELFKTGRNAKGGKSKSTDIITYRYATGFEYLIGSLYLKDKNRVDEIMNEILGVL